MASKLPWMKFFPADWLADAALRSCSFETRGLWIDILCHMHRNDRRGYLQINGSPVTPDQLTRLTGCSTEQANRCFAELLSSGAASALPDGTLYNRRMLREENKRGLCSEAGKKGGGNPALRTNRSPIKVGPKVDPKVNGHPNESILDPPIKVDPKVGLKVGLKVGPKVPLASEEEREEELREEEREEIESGVGGAGGRGQKPSRRRQPTTPEDDPSFLAFWSAYPNRKKKLPAFKVWLRLDVDDDLLAVILDSLARQKSTDDWRKDGGKYIPHPTTWLNGRQWEDELRPDLPVASGPTLEQKADYEAKLAKQRADYEQHQRDMEAARKLRESQGGSLFGDRLKPRQPAKEAEHGSD